jgi:hypothetical protein
MSLKIRIQILEQKMKPEPAAEPRAVVIHGDDGQYSWRGQYFDSLDQVPGMENGVVIIEIEDGRRVKHG